MIVGSDRFKYRVNADGAWPQIYPGKPRSAGLSSLQKFKKVEGNPNAANGCRGWFAGLPGETPRRRPRRRTGAVAASAYRGNGHAN